jgi:hypothetical protein
MRNALSDSTIRQNYVTVTHWLLRGPAPPASQRIVQRTTYTVANAAVRTDSSERAASAAIASPAVGTHSAWRMAMPLSLGSLHVLCTVASDGIRGSCTTRTFGVMCTLPNTSIRLPGIGGRWR